MSALWLVVGVLGQIFLGLGSLLILRLFGVLPLDVSLGGPLDGGTVGSIVVSVIVVRWRRVVYVACASGDGT